jgi:hypothetical protein
MATVATEVNNGSFLTRRRRRRQAAQLPFVSQVQDGCSVARRQRRHDCHRSHLCLALRPHRRQLRRRGPGAQVRWEEERVVDGTEHGKDPLAVF